MMIAGVKGISLIDYPQKVSTVLYLSRCNFRCPFCHNRQLVLNEDVPPIDLHELLRIIVQRISFIDGVVITGGEPTIDRRIIDLAASIKKLGLAVKLDTNGSNPEVLKTLLDKEIVDFVAMDIKTSWRNYRTAVGVDIDCSKLMESIKLLKDSNVVHEFRTTCVPGIVDLDDIIEISDMIGTAGRYALQQFQSENTLDPEFAHLRPYPPAVMVKFLEAARKNAGMCRLIGI